MHSTFPLFFLLLIIPIAYSQPDPNPHPPESLRSLAATQTKLYALLLSFLQCFPNTTHPLHNLDIPSQQLLQIHQTFNPSAHLQEYSNLTDIQSLIAFVKNLQQTGTPNNLPFTNAPPDIAALNTILTVLYHNAHNWPLFYKTSVWLLQRVNQAQLFWALMVVATEKFTDTVTVPTTTAILPQLFLPKNYVLPAAGLQKRDTPLHPLHYWLSDPGLHEFHVRWHIDNPFWWNEAVYQVPRDRKGELFLYVHHQIVCRYNAESLSNGIGEVEPLGLTPEYRIPEEYIPDVVNMDYKDFFIRPANTPMSNFDDGSILNVLREYCQRVSQGIEDGYFVAPNGDHVLFQGENGTDILGATIESSSVHSANLAYYGSFHNFMHRLLAGMLRTDKYPIPGIQSHSETAMRDPAFYRIHKKVDNLYLKYKATLPAYTQVGQKKFRN